MQVDQFGIATHAKQMICQTTEGLGTAVAMADSQLERLRRLSGISPELPGQTAQAVHDSPVGTQSRHLFEIAQRD